MIYHIFPANIYHLSPQLIRSIVVKTPQDHMFFLIGQTNKQTDWSIYENIFNELNFSSFQLFDNNSAFFKKSKLKKDAFIILHSDSYNWKIHFSKNNFKNVHWICWGSGVDVKLNLKSLVSYLLKILIYARFRSIITLSLKDKEKLQKKFRIKNVENISYFESVNDLFDFNKKNLKSEYKKEVSVFIGNNSSAISTYLPLLRKLEVYKSSINITAMLNYDLAKNNIYKELLEVGLDIYGLNFKTDENFYSLKDFPLYINKCDIYVCSVEEQTGLGAIYSALKLGKKIFLAGNNYEYITSLGCKISHVDEIEKMKVEDFIRPLPLEIQYYNFDLIMTCLSDDKLIEKWQLFYNKYRNSNN